MMRRSLLQLLGLGMVGRGVGGTPPEPAGYRPPSLPGQAAGTVNIFRGRLVIVFGPSGAVNGVFVYAPGTTPGPGNPPVESMTNSTADPYGNTVQPGIVSYSGTAFAQLNQGQLQFTGFSQATITATGDIALDSGVRFVGDSPGGVFVLSASANDGVHRLAQLVVDQVQLTAGASVTLPIAHLTQFPIPGAATLATTIAAVNAMYSALVTAQVFAS